MKTTKTTNFSSVLDACGRPISVSVETFLDDKMIGPGSIECYWMKKRPVWKLNKLTLHVKLQIINVETDQYLEQTIKIDTSKFSACILDIPEGIQVRDMDFIFSIDEISEVINPSSDLFIPKKEEEYMTRIKVAFPEKVNSPKADYSIVRNGAGLKPSSYYSKLPQMSFDYVEASKKMDEIFLAQKIDSLIASGDITSPEEYFPYMKKLVLGLLDQHNNQ